MAPRSPRDLQESHRMTDSSRDPCATLRKRIVSAEDIRVLVPIQGLA
jgi:hypothetical protein